MKNKKVLSRSKEIVRLRKKFPDLKDLIDPLEKSTRGNPRSQKMINARTEEINSVLNKKAKTFSVPMSPYNGEGSPASGFRYRADAWQNMITGLGTSRDKRTGSLLDVAASSTNYVFFEDLYHGDDIAATACEIPSQEMVREWINISNDEEEKADSSPVADKGSVEPDTQLKVAGGSDAAVTANPRMDGGPGSGPHGHEMSEEARARTQSERAFTRSEEAKKETDPVRARAANDQAHLSHDAARLWAKKIGDTRGEQIHERASHYHFALSQKVEGKKGIPPGEFPPRRYNEDSQPDRDSFGYLLGQTIAIEAYNANLHRMRELVGVHLDSAALPSFIAPTSAGEGTMIENMRINAPSFLKSPSLVQQAESKSAPVDQRDESVNEDDSQSVGKATLLFLEFLEAQTKIYESLVWSKVFGGSLLFMGIDDGHAGDANSMALPLDEENIKSFNFLSVFDRWDVDVFQWYRDPNHPKFGLPELYRIRQTSSAGGTGLSLSGDIVHETRCIRFDGSMVNRRRRVRNNGWADSVFIKLAETIRDFGTAYGGVGVLLQDFSQSVFKMKGLYESLIGDGDEVIKKRLAIMDMSRSMVRAVMIDADGEEFANNGRAVSGLDTLLDRFALRLSAATRIPVCLLMGQSPSGLQATGASDIRFFYDYIKAQQEKILRPRLNRLLSLIFKAKNGPTHGKTPKNWSLSFNTLWQSTEVETATLRKTVADTDNIYASLGVLTADEIAKSRFSGDRYSTETVLDEKSRDMQKKSDDKAKMLEIKHGPGGVPPPPSPGSPKPSPFHPPEQENGPAREDHRLDGGPGSGPRSRGAA